MRNRNICKFITVSTSDKLNVYSFIYESNPNVMKEIQKLQHYRAIIIKQGKGNFKIDNKFISYNIGSLIFCFKDELFSVQSNEICEYIYIDFDGIRAENLFRRFGINKNNRKFPGFEGLLPLWHDSLSHACEENIDLASESILLYTFSRFSSIAPEQNKIINTIIDISEEEFTNSELSITDIAKELSYNPKYISHFFKEKMKMSYSEYLRNLRIKYAVSLFDNGIDSVKNVAFLSGFSDPLYFSKVFKKTIGVSPKEYKFNIRDTKQC